MTGLAEHWPSTMQKQWGPPRCHMVTSLVVEAWIKDTSKLVVLHSNTSHWYQEKIGSLQEFIFAVHSGFRIKMRNSNTLVIAKF